jgi:hypothetical protein
MRDPSEACRDAQRATSAERMRRCRARRAVGDVRMAINMDAATIGRLINRGWLAADRQQDGTAVGTAVSAFLRQELSVSEERWVPPAPIAAPQQEPSFAERLAAALARREATQISHS